MFDGPANLYRHGMWWQATASGTVDGIPFGTNDIVFALAADPADEARDWLLESEVRWVVWDKPLTSLPFFMTKAPNPLHGVPCGTAHNPQGFQDPPRDRLVLEVLDTVANEWVDLTPDAYGIEITRGASYFAGDTEVGVLRFELESAGHKYAPWRDLPYTDVCTPIRVAVSDGAGEFEPVFTGELESWTERIVDEVPVVEVVAADTWSRLAACTIDGYDLNNSGNPDLYQLLDDLTDRAGFGYGIAVWVGMTGFETTDYAGWHVSTEPDGQGGWEYLGIVSGNVGDILRTACKSLRLWARVRRDGLLKIGRQYPPIFNEVGGQDYLTEHPSLWPEPTPPALIVSTSETPAGDQMLVEAGKDLDGIANHIRTTGPPPVPFQGNDLGPDFVENEDAASIAKRGRRTLEETIWRTSGGQGIGIGELLALRKDLEHRLDRLELDLDHNGPTVFLLDLGAAAEITHDPPGAPTALYEGWVRGYTHRITPLNRSAVDWTVEVAVDTYTVTSPAP